MMANQPDFKGRQYKPNLEMYTDTLLFYNCLHNVINNVKFNNRKKKSAQLNK